MFAWTRIKSLSLIIIAVSLIALIQSKSNAQSSDKPNIYFGVRDSASSDKYCNSLFNYLKKYHNNSFDFYQVKFDFNERLYQKKEIFHEGNRIKLAIECGSNTITTNRIEYLETLQIKSLDGTTSIPYPGKFSKIPFMETGSKMLLLKGENNEIYEEYLKGNLFSQQNPEHNKTIITGNSKNQIINTNKNLFEAIYPSAARPEFINESQDICEKLKATSNDIVAFIGDENRVIEEVERIKNNKCNLNKDFAVVPKYGTLNKQEYGIIVYENGIPEDCTSDACKTEYKEVTGISIDRWSSEKLQERKKQEVNLLNFPLKWLENQFEIWYKGDLSSFNYLLISIVLLISAIGLLLLINLYNHLYKKPINLLNKKINNDIHNQSHITDQEQDENAKTFFEQVLELEQATGTLEKSNLLKDIPSIQKYINNIRVSLQIAQVKLMLQKVLQETPQLNNLKELKVKIVDSSSSNQEFQEKLISMASEGSQAAIEEIIDSLPFANIPWAFIKAAIDEAISDND